MGRWRGNACESDVERKCFCFIRIFILILTQNECKKWYFDCISGEYVDNHVKNMNFCGKHVHKALKACDQCMEQRHANRTQLWKSGLVTRRR